MALQITTGNNLQLRVAISNTEVASSIAMGEVNPIGDRPPRHPKRPLMLGFNTFRIRM